LRNRDRKDWLPFQAAANAPSLKNVVAEEPAMADYPYEGYVIRTQAQKDWRAIITGGSGLAKPSIARATLQEGEAVTIGRAKAIIDELLLPTKNP
jgi:hypothetical protein